MRRPTPYLSCSLLALLLAACSHEADDALRQEAANAILFSPTVESPATRATYVGNIDLDILQSLPNGFGVFGYLTEEATWETATKDKAYSGFPTPDFMNNQPVSYTSRWVDDKGETQKGWAYAPLKYWPNSTNNATSRHISFFAYAPQVDTPEASGISALPDGSDPSPHIGYTMGTIGQQVDLLYAKATDATRNGQGLITLSDNPSAYYERVEFKFRHALASIDVYVVLAFDNNAPTEKDPVWANDTKIFVSQLALTPIGNTMTTTGVFDLSSQEWRPDGSTSATSLCYTTDDLTPRLRGTTVEGLGTTVAEANSIRVYELDKWSDHWSADGTTKDNGTLPSGVTEDSNQRLNIASRTLMVIPQEVTLQPTLKYSLVTRDDGLQHDYLTDTEGAKGNNTRRYTRTTVTSTGSGLTLNLAPGKHYTLLLRIAVEHISLEVASVEDWDFPMRFTPTVTDNTPTGIEHTVNEPH